MLDRFVHGMTVVGWPSVGVGVGLDGSGPAESLAAVHRLVVDERVVAAVHADEEAPLVLRAALAHGARHRVARRTGVRRVLVGRVRVFDEPAFRLEGDGAHFVGGQTVVVRQVLEDIARVGRIEVDLVEGHHPLDGLFPVFRACATIRDACHPHLVVDLVTAPAAGPHELALNRDALVLYGLCRLCGRVCRHARANQKKKPANPFHHDRHQES